MADRYWDGGTATDPTNVNNWSDTDGGATPASSVPTTGDTAHYTANGNGNPCTLTAAWSLGAISVEAGYASKIDLATYTITFDDGGAVSLAGGVGGEFDWGSGGLDVTNSVVDWSSHAGTWTPATGTLTAHGTGSITAASTMKVTTCVIDTGATYAIDGLYVTATWTLNGQITIATGKTACCYFHCQASFGQGAEPSGGGRFLVLAGTDGNGIVAKHESVTMSGLAILEYRRDYGTTSPILPPGIYMPGKVLFSIWENVAKSIVLSAGSYIFGDIEFFNANASTLTIDCETNDPDIEFRGDVIWTNTGGGTIDYVPGSGEASFTGTADQDIDFGGETIEPVTIDKAAGEIDFASGNFVLAESPTNLYHFKVSGDADFDLANSGYAVTLADGGNFTAESSGTFDAGNASVSITNGDLDFYNQTTWTGGSSNWTLNGTCSLKPKQSSIWTAGNITIAEGAVVTQTGATYFYVGATSHIRGSLSLAGEYIAGNSEDIHIYSTADISYSGFGKLYFANTTSGHGLVTLDTGATLNAPVFCDYSSMDLPSGQYGGRVTIQTREATKTITLGAGGFTFGGGLELRTHPTTGTGTLTLDARTNSPTVSITSLIIDLNNTGDIVIDSDGAEVNWTITGDVIDEITGGGTFGWQPGTGTITASGGSPQDWDFHGETIEAVVNQKSGDTLTLSGEVTMASYTQTSGGFDPNGQTIETTGDMSITGGTVTDPESSAITVGGTFRATGVDLIGTGAWTLDVTGSAVVRASTVAYCNASGGQRVRAYTCTDGGNNQNVQFISAAGVSMTPFDGAVEPMLPYSC